MFKKTAIAAATIATAIAAAPVSTANAGSVNFSFGFQTPHGYVQFGNGGYHPQPHPQALSCWQARNYLKSHFHHVWKVECHGKIYTFKVKNWGPTKIVKLNKWNGNYWFA